MDPERRKIVVQCLLYAFFDYAHPERMEPPYNMIALMWQAYQHGKFHAVTMDETYRVTVNGRTIDDPPILHTGDVVIFWPVPIDLNDPFGTADVIGGLYPALCRPPKLARGVALALIGGVLTAGAIVLLLLRLALYSS
jgi:hypothetical protein